MILGRRLRALQALRSLRRAGRSPPGVSSPYVSQRRARVAVRAAPKGRRLSLQVENTAEPHLAELLSAAVARFAEPVRCKTSRASFVDSQECIQLEKEKRMRDGNSDPLDSAIEPAKFSSHETRAI